MTPKEKFKVGFLLKCAEAGLTMDQTHEVIRRTQTALEKHAVGEGTPIGAVWNALKAIGGKGLDVSKAVVNKAVDWAPTIAIGGPVALGVGVGGAGGALAAKATDFSDDDPEDIKTQELIDEYERLAEQTRLSKSLRDYKALGTRRGRPLY